jgi:hypothetical protein
VNHKKQGSSKERMPSTRHFSPPDKRGMAVKRTSEFEDLACIEMAFLILNSPQHLYLAMA